MEPFVGEAKIVPSEFEIDFLLDGVRHQYGFSVNSEAVLHEWLYVYRNRVRQVWFKRNESGPMVFGAEMPGANRTIEALVRKNSLFLSAAAQNNHQKLSPIYHWFSQSLAFRVADRAISGVNVPQFCQDEKDRAAITQLLAHADLGIAEIRLEDIPWAAPGNTMEQLASLPSAVADWTEQSIKVMRLVHRIGGQNVPLDAKQESHGTLAFLSLIGFVVSALKRGGVICVDELDASLHPLIAVEVIRLFSSPITNPRSVQLIFNTHDTNLLSSSVLRRDQVWFTEKGPDGTSHLYPLSDYKPKRRENLENGYLQGRYGAIPFIHPDFLASPPGGDGETK